MATKPIALPQRLLTHTVAAWGIAATLVFASCCLGASPAVTRGPYLQSATSSNLLVRWRTDVVGMGRVQFGTNAASLNFTANDSVSATNHAVRLTNLAPDTLYYYSVGLTNLTLTGGHFFRSAPPAGSRRPFRAWVLGDFGFTNASAVPVRNAYENFTTNRYTDLWLMVGDNCYHNGADSTWQGAVFNTYSNLLRQTPVWSCIGNQESFGLTTIPTTAPYFENFTFPTAGEAGGAASGTEKYYSFEFGNVHFICLDSMTSPRTPGSPMLQWLESDLAQSSSEWTVAFWHHPAYSRGSRDSDTQPEQIEMRTHVMPLLDAHGVDLVLAGHSHSYERSYLIDGHYGLSATFNTNTMVRAGGSGRVEEGGAYDKPTFGPGPREGAVHLVAGSGAALGGGSLNHPVMFRSFNQLGSVALDFHANRLDARFIRETGAIDDWFTITKGATPMRLTAALAAPGTAQLDWPAVPKRGYAVQFAPQLGGAWTNLTAVLMANGPELSTNVLLPAGGGGFLRLWSDGR